MSETNTKYDHSVLRLATDSSGSSVDDVLVDVWVPEHMIPIIRASEVARLLKQLVEAHATKAANVADAVLDKLETIINNDIEKASGIEFDSEFDKFYTNDVKIFEQ